jgi:hypothetical protein
METALRSNPKAVELVVVATFPDLSIYGLESASNGAADALPSILFP